MLHYVIDIAVKNGELSVQGGVIDKSEGFTDDRNKAVLKHRKEKSAWIYISISEHLQNAKLGGAWACDVDQESARTLLSVVSGDG